MRTRLRPGEEVAAVVRRHWIVLAGPAALMLFLVGCLAAAFFIRRPGVVPAAGALCAASALWTLWRWLDWRCDLWATTSHRVIDESGVLAVRMVDTPLDTINNVMVEQPFWGRVMGYGTVNIQTAAESGSMTILDVAGPQELRETILDLKERHRENLAARQAAPIAAALRAGAAAGAGAAPGGGAVAAEGAAAAGTRECPYCAETIKARATVCRFCGRSL
ncbi:MAG TPA: PH domain-containing protein [Candidatus Polarisedimenticolia bacterium]|nr:PH domain-containing protein [Candidatus Polarisedimenticolia bacterium]